MSTIAVLSLMTPIANGVNTMISCVPKLCCKHTIVVDSQIGVNNIKGDIKNSGCHISSQMDEHENPIGCVIWCHNNNKPTNKKDNNNEESESLIADDNKSPAKGDDDIKPTYGDLFRQHSLCLGWISRENVSSGHGPASMKESIMLISSKENMKEMMTVKIDGENFDTIEINSPASCLFNARLVRSHIPYDEKPTIHQQKILDIIMERANKSHKGFSLLVHGMPGAQKSEIAYLLAAKLKCPLLLDYNPLVSGRSLGEYYAEVQPTKKKYLVVAIEEIDKMFETSYEGKLNPETEYFTRQVYNKSTLNSFLDSIKKRYAYTICVCTTNMSAHNIIKTHLGGDPSSVRRGRFYAYTSNFSEENMKIQLEGTDYKLPWE